MQNVLVTAIGSFAADIVIKNLKELKMIVVGCDIYPRNWIADAYNVDKFFQVPPVAKANEYLNAIHTICLENDVKYIFPLTDIEVDALNAHRKWFEDHQICLCISSYHTLQICRNKKRLQEYIDAQDIGVKTIPSVLLSECRETPFPYPIICKPCDGRSSQGISIVRNDLQWKLARLDVDATNYLVQPYISGSIVTVDVIRHTNGHAVAVARKELLRTQNGAGTSVLVFKDDVLEDLCKKLASCLGIEGCVNFEFLVDEQANFHFIECNPRFSGGVEFTCIAGYDCVVNHMRCFVDQDIDTFELENNMYIARKYEEYVTDVVK